ncbi:MAG: hypothetical protein NXI02_24490 [Rhodobacteraceae bacterium]|nr:hypothetical protein [Paracoccaceae bacterium]
MASLEPELIAFLDHHWCSVMIARTAQGAEGSSPEETLTRLAELRHEFLNELSQMTEEQVASLTTQVLVEQDKERPFNRFGTDANYEHFGRCAFLTADEAAALTMGKDPRVVSWEMVQPYTRISIFADKFAGILDLIERAIKWGELGERFTPLEFLTWAHRYKLSVPEAFVQSTFARGEAIRYWHDLCDVLQAKLSEAEAELEAVQINCQAVQDQLDAQDQQSFDDWLDAMDDIGRLQEGHDSEVTSLREALESAQSDNSALQEQLAQTKAGNTEEDALSTSERKSLLTIIMALATDGYGYSPNQKKSTLPKDIEGAAALIGLSITDDTARKYLKEAAKLKGFVSPDTDV